MLYFGAMVGGVFGLTLFLQLGEHFSAVHAGLTLAPFAIGTAVAAPFGGMIAARHASRPLIQAGVLVSLLGQAAMAVLIPADHHVSSWALAGPLFVYGLGMGLFIVPVFGTIIAAVSDAETGSASAALNAIQQLGGAIGVAVLGTIFFTVLGHHGFAPALTRILWCQVGALGVTLALSPLLPLQGRPEAEVMAAAAEADVACRPPAAAGARRS
jgi:MFS family permease